MNSFILSALKHQVSTTWVPWVFIIFIIAGLIFSMFNMDLVTSLSASAASIGNIGPALGDVGPYDNWGHFPSIAKWVSCFCMLLGRLEIFTVMILFSKLFWRH